MVTLAGAMTAVTVLVAVAAVRARAEQRRLLIARAAALYGGVYAVGALSSAWPWDAAHPLYTLIITWLGG